MEVSVKDRFLLFLRMNNIAKATAERLCGLSNGYLTQVKNVSSDKLSKILNGYPQLNRVWLLTGEGQMLNSSNGVVVTNNGSINGDNNMNVSLQPTSNSGNIEVEQCEVEEIPIIPKVACIEPNVDTLSYVKHNDVTTSPIVHQFPTSDVWYPVFTDTMSPDYLPGDKVALFAYPKGEEEVLNNRAYVIDTKRNGTILCKLTKTDEGYIARYKNPEYPNDFIKYADVIRIYKVVGLIRVIM